MSWLDRLKTENSGACTPYGELTKPTEGAFDSFVSSPHSARGENFSQDGRQAPMTAEEGKAILAWLARIEETDPATIAEVIERCRHDADARAYFLMRAAEA